MIFNDSDRKQASIRMEQKVANDSNRNITELNETERALCGQLMLISTVFLTVSIVALGNSTVLSNLHEFERLLLIVNFTLLISSIACGIKYYFELIKFYNQWGRLYHEAYEEFRDANIGFIKLDVEKLNKKSESQTEATDTLWLKRQITLISVAAIGCILFLGIIVFSGDIYHNQSSKTSDQYGRNFHTKRNHLYDQPEHLRY